MIEVMINGRSVQTAQGTTILEAAQLAGVDIPTLCNQPRITEKNCTESGDCKICSCKVEGYTSLLTACNTQAVAGMQVWPEHDDVIAARREILERMLATHPMDCLNCAKLGACKLQRYCERYGVDKAAYIIPHCIEQKDLSNDFYERDMNKCISCGKCVRICRHLMGVEALRMDQLGLTTKVRPIQGDSMADTNCVSCGNCVSYCPVGALTAKAENKFRYWEVRRVRTTCSYCGVGCQMELLVKGNRVVGVEPFDGQSNRGLLCVKGKFGFDFINHPDRLNRPLIRRDGKLQPASWDEALDLIEVKIKQIKADFGADAIAGFSSARVTNEENYLFQKFMRAAIGTNNVDHCARLCHSSTVAGLATTLGSGAMTNPIADILNSDVIFLTGSNITTAHPVMGALVRQAMKKGAKLIVADPKRIALAEEADIFLQIKPGTSVALSNAMLHVIFKQGLEDKEYIEKHTVGADNLKACVEKYTPEYAGEICGVEPEKIRKAAELYASGHKSYIAYAMGITQHINGTDNVMSISNLALVTGNLGRSGCGVNPLRGQNNVQGACDMGALPTDYPAYQKVWDQEENAKFEAAWGVTLSKEAGLTVTETIPAILDGRVKMLYVMGENPVVSDPDSRHVVQALEKAFVVAQDIFLSETAQLADVVLPALCFAEKEGTFTNTERRVQRIRKAVPGKGQCMDDWRVLMELMNRLGYPCHYHSPEDIFNEMRQVTPSYGGMTYQRIDKEGLCWPCPTKEHAGTPILHVNRPVSGVGVLKTMEWEPSPETLLSEYPIVLMTGRILYHYHTRTMTDKSKAIHKKHPALFVEINPRDAAELGIETGDWGRITSKRGTIISEMVVCDTLSPGTAFIPFHWGEGANVLTDAAVLDPTSKIPGLKQVGVRIEKVEREQR